MSHRPNVLGVFSWVRLAEHTICVVQTIARACHGRVRVRVRMRVRVRVRGLARLCVRRPSGRST